MTVATASTSWQAQRNGTLYVGVTNSLGRRAFQHPNGVGSEFTSKYSVRLPVWYEHYGNVSP